MEVIKNYKLHFELERILKPHELLLLNWIAQKKINMKTQNRTIRFYEPLQINAQYFRLYLCTGSVLSMTVFIMHPLIKLAYNCNYSYFKTKPFQNFLFPLLRKLRKLRNKRKVLNVLTLHIQIPVWIRSTQELYTRQW